MIQSLPKEVFKVWNEIENDHKDEEVEEEAHLWVFFLFLKKQQSECAFLESWSDWFGLSLTFPTLCLFLHLWFHVLQLPPLL